MHRRALPLPHSSYTIEYTFFMTLCRRETEAREVRRAMRRNVLGGGREGKCYGWAVGGVRRRSNNKWFHYKADE